MSWQAQTAVTKHSQQAKLQPFKLLHLLAERADKEGVIDPAPSQPTLATELGCTDRMIRNYLDTLIDTGELEQTRVGGGPGRPSAYRILLPMPTEKEESAGAKQGKGNEIPSAKLADLEVKVEIMTTNLSIVTRKVEEMVERFGALMEAKVEKVEGKGGNQLVELVADDPVLEPEEKKPPIVPHQELPPMAAGEENGRRTPKQQERDKTMAELERLFSMATQLSVPKSGTKAEQRSAGSLWWNPLREMLDEVKGDMELFEKHLKAAVAKMRRDGLTLSYPKSVAAIFKSIAASSASGTNGVGEDGGQQWVALQAAVRTGDWKQVDEHTKQVARDMGGRMVFKTMRPDQEAMLKKQFYERLNGYAIH